MSVDGREFDGREFVKILQQARQVTQRDVLLLAAVVDDDGRPTVYMAGIKGVISPDCQEEFANRLVDLMMQYGPPGFIQKEGGSDDGTS